MSKFSNANIASLLRSVAAALTIKKRNIFEVRAYQNAADAIEHSTSEIKDLWEEGKLDEIPGVGKNIQSYLDELFKTGEVKHFEIIKKDIKPVVFDLLEIPGVGPKTASDLSELGIKNIDDLREKLESEQLLKVGKVSLKLQEKLTLGLVELAGLKSNRMLLPFAFSHAEKILDYLKKCPDLDQADPLGSLRRRVATIGDLDFAASSSNPEKVIEYFTKMPGVKEVVSEGENKVMLVLNSGLHVDLLVGDPDTYGALLQHFTGSKSHNIHLREYAQKKGFSLSEYGFKDTKTGEIISIKTEDDFYKHLGMQTPPPEIREDTGEIEAAISHKLPKLIEYNEIKGDFHLHSNFSLEPSHGPGLNNLEEIVRMAEELNYKYMGLSDHSPAFTTHSEAQIIALIEKRTKVIQKIKESTKSIHVLNGLEIDILGDGALSVPDAALKTLDYCIVGIHSGHRGTKEQITKRILTALSNPYVSVLAHPTGRIINERGSYDADWEEVFKFCVKNKKLIEINAFPNRLDLRDDLVKMAISFGVKFIIDTDAHEISQMENMEYGIAVARRGWVEAKDVVNTWEWTKLKDWFNIK